MRRVILESPFAGNVVSHVAYARSCIRDCLRRDEAPIASHLLYTQPGILDDNRPDERALGIEAGHIWLGAADAVVVYRDYGISVGMQQGILRATNAGIQVEFRNLAPPCRDNDNTGRCFP